jgi:hypothetical protein
MKEESPENMAEKDAAYEIHAFCAGVKEEYDTAGSVNLEFAECGAFSSSCSVCIWDARPGAAAVIFSGSLAEADIETCLKDKPWPDSKASSDERSRKIF